MKNEYSEHQIDPLLCIFSQYFIYRSSHIGTDLSSAQPCHVHCARVRVRLCVCGKGGGGQGREWH